MPYNEIIFVHSSSFSLLKIGHFPPLVLGRGCFQTITAMMVGNFHLIPCLNLFLATLYPFVLVTALFLSLNNSSPFPVFTPLMTAIRSHLSLHFARWNKPAVLGLWYGAVRCRFCRHRELILELKLLEWKTHLEPSLVALPKGLSPGAVPKWRKCSLSPLKSRF